MKVFVKISSTICLVLGSIFLLNKLYYFGATNNKNLKAAYVSSSKINATILIHGPCEPLWMLNPTLIDSITKLNSYNLALSHSDFADNYLHLYLYLKNNNAPKLLLLYVTPESMDKNYNTFNTYRFAQYLSDDTVLQVVKECDADYAKYTPFPFLNYAYYNKNITFNIIQGIKHKLENRKRPYFINGFEPPAKILWDNNIEEMREQYPKGYTFKIDSLRVKYLIKTIQLAQSRGINVVLYESPVLTESLSCLKNRDEIIFFVKQLAVKNKVEYIVFKDEKLSASRENYISSLNLSEKSLPVFNDTLALFIKRIIEQ